MQSRIIRGLRKPLISVLIFATCVASWESYKEVSCRHRDSSKQVSATPTVAVAAAKFAKFGASALLAAYCVSAFCEQLQALSASSLWDAFVLLVHLCCGCSPADCLNLQLHCLAQLQIRHVCKLADAVSIQHYCTETLSLLPVWQPFTMAYTFLFYVSSSRFPCYLFWINFSLLVQAHPSSWLPSSSLEATDPFNLTNFALALLLAFRLDASYSRFMEGRRIWGNIVADSRNIVRQVATLHREAYPAGICRLPWRAKVCT